MGIPAQVIERPQDLMVPEPVKFFGVLSALTEAGQGDFILELLEALSSAQETGNLREVQTVLDSWWISRRFASLPKLEEAIASAAEAVISESRYTAEDIADRLGVS